MRTLRTIFCVVLAAGLSLTFVDSAAAIKILFHGRNPGVGLPPEPTFRGDPAAFDHLQAVFGATNVDFMEGILAAADGSSAIGYDVVFISGGMASSNTRGKYEDSPVGIVSGEHAITSCCTVGNFAMVTGTGRYRRHQDPKGHRYHGPEPSDSRRVERSCEFFRLGGAE